MNVRISEKHQFMEVDANNRTAVRNILQKLIISQLFHDGYTKAAKNLVEVDSNIDTLPASDELVRLFTRGLVEEQNDLKKIQQINDANETALTIKVEPNTIKVQVTADKIKVQPDPVVSEASLVNNNTTPVTQLNTSSSSSKSSSYGKSKSRWYKASPKKLKQQTLTKMSHSFPKRTVDVSTLKEFQGGSRSSQMNTTNPVKRKSNELSPIDFSKNSVKREPFQDFDSECTYFQEEIEDFGSRKSLKPSNKTPSKTKLPAFKSPHKVNAAQFDSDMTCFEPEPEIEYFQINKPIKSTRSLESTKKKSEPEPKVPVFKLPQPKEIVIASQSNTFFDSDMTCFEPEPETQHKSLKSTKELPEKFVSVYQPLKPESEETTNLAESNTFFDPDPDMTNFDPAEMSPLPSSPEPVPENVPSPIVRKQEEKRPVFHPAKSLFDPEMSCFEQSPGNSFMDVEEDPPISNAVLKEINVKKELEPPTIEKEIPTTSKFILPPKKSKSKFNNNKKDQFNCTDDLIRDFDRLPGRKEPENPYGKLSRKKEDRAKMNGTHCDQCKAYFEGLESQISEAEMQRILNKCSRHRTFRRPVDLNLTPTDFWSTNMPSTQEAYRTGLIKMGVASPPAPKKRYDLYADDN